MLAAMATSIGACGTVTQPRIAADNVRLWASVKALMVTSSDRPSGTSSNRPSTNSKWSGPVSR